MEVLSSRVLRRPSDFARSLAFYRDTLRLKVYREYGFGPSYGIVFFLGGGYLEMSGTAPHPDVGHDHLALWLQVPDLAEAYERLGHAADVTVLEPPERKPWGLVEMWLADPDGVRICIVEVPDDHPLRRRPD